MAEPATRAVRPSACRSGREQENGGESPLPIRPALRDLEPGGLREGRDLRQVELVGALREEGFAGREGDLEIEVADDDGLIAEALEMHFDPPLLAIVAGQMAKGRELETASELPIDSI